ncbi:amino acid adenylation domain-containing protein [Clostridium sp. LCP25S3_F10]|uniref:amino acid adenylation domain-containing protein n=1 Tax=Clostridium sp. LCP25S3_F10 TaxID=3438750 RepID=UPI003F8E43AA
MKELLREYNKIGVKLWVENDKLHFKAPKGVLDDIKKAELKEKKDEIIKYLKAISSNKIKHDKENRYSTFPLTDIQTAYLVGRNNAYDYGGVGCKVYAELTSDIIDEERLEKAWHKLINRHDMLRTVVYREGYQKVLEKVELPKLEFLDLRGLKDNEIKEELMKIKNYLSTKQYMPESWPLYDLKLSTQDSKSILHISIDMLIADFISINNIISELEYLYNNENGELEDLDVQFRDVVLYQQLDKENDERAKEKAKKYWLDRINTLPEAPELPLAEGKKNNYINFKQYNYFLPKEKWRTICDKAKKYNLTPSSAILTAYAEVIGLWSRQSNFCINITILNRPNIHPQIQKLVGDFTEVDILEINQKGKKCFAEYAKGIQKQLWSDLENISFSGIKVLRELKRQRRRDIIIPVVYTSTIGANISDNKISEEKIGMNLTYKISQTPQVWIDCQVSEQRDGVLINWDVREDIFKDGVIEEAFKTFGNLLEDLVKNNETWISNTSINLSPETKEIRSEINNHTLEFDEKMLYDKILGNIKNKADNKALYADGKYITYRELGEYSLAIQKSLLENNIKAGDNVCIALPKGVWQIGAVLGTLFAGCVYIPIDINQPLARKESIINDSKARILITNGSYKQNHNIKNCTVIEVENLNPIKNNTIEPCRVDANAPAYIIYTSGSTGKPKGVVISHKAALNTIIDINIHYHLCEHDRILGIANLAFDLSVYDIFGSLMAGGMLVLPNASDVKSPSHWYDLIKNEKITVWNSVPAQMQMLLTYMQEVKNDKCNDLRLVLLSGDWIPVTLPKIIWSYFDKAEIISLGGATEASIWSISYQIERGKVYENSIPYGIPLSNQYFYVLNKNLDFCPNWVIGDIYIGGPGLALEYFNDLKLTKERFIKHPLTQEMLYHTGDIGRYRSDGIIEFLGREDTQVKLNGHRIELNEIESTIQKMENIETAAVIVNDKSVNNSIYAYIQPKVITSDTKSLVDKDYLLKAISTSGDEVTKGIDRELFVKWTEISNKTAVLDIMNTMQKLGIFVDESEFSLGEIQAIIKCNSKYKDLVATWISVLKKENLIKENLKTNKYYLLNKDINLNSSKNSWSEWKKLEEKMNYGKTIVDYFESSSNHLIELLREEVSSIDLLFPQGNFDIALAAYHDNFISSSLNKVIIESTKCILEEFNKLQMNRPFRILEVGAGVGGTSLDLIPELDKYNVEYLYTDLSQSFLNRARKEFECYPWVEYGLFDINKEYYLQDIKEDSFDLIICNNVLHNAKSGTKVLESLSRIMIYGASIVVVDTIGENYSLLTSMEFHINRNNFDDFRRENKQVFFTREQWHDLFKEANIEIAGEYPTKGDLLNASKQAVFVGQLIGKRKVIKADEVKTNLKSQLPEYMVPSNIYIVDKIPLTNNGKVDRETLKNKVQDFDKVNKDLGEAPKGDLEERISKIWAKVLNKDTMYRNEDFYQCGGDSLVGAQVVATMRETIPEAENWEWDQLMVEILQTPTIAKIAEKITNKLNESKFNDSINSVESKKSLITLAEGDNSKFVKVIFHDGTGTITPYNALIPYLLNHKNRKETILAFIYGDEEEYTSYPYERLIECLGEKYARELIKTKATKFELIGYCMGGLIAVETAKALLEQGMEVKPVITIDTTPCDYRMNNEFFMERTFGLLIGSELEKAGHNTDNDLLKRALNKLLAEKNTRITNEDLFNLDGEFESIAKCYKELEKVPFNERLINLYKNVPFLKEDVSIYQKNRMENLYRVFSQSFKGVISYGIEPFMHDVKALNCEDKSSLFLPIKDTKNAEFWNEITFGNLEMIQIKGNHFTCLQEPLVKKVADIIMGDVNE